MKLNQFITSGRQIILQWIVLILLGAKNIEQSKLINFKALSKILGTVVPNLYYQRNQLTRIAQGETLTELIRFNSNLVLSPNDSDFYYDPHTKHYTGMKKILKGWCPSVRLADKALHMDFIHTSRGEPVYLENCDNYDDLRMRFPGMINRFRKKVPITYGKTLTFILDRGIYSIKLFGAVIDNDQTHIITWEK